MVPSRSSYTTRARDPSRAAEQSCKRTVAKARNVRRAVLGCCRETRMPFVDTSSLNVVKCLPGKALTDGRLVEPSSLSVEV